MKVLFILVLLSRLGMAAITEVPVGANLQSYVDAASAGDTLQLKGSYGTNLVVTKSLVLEGPSKNDRRDLTAQDKSLPIVRIESPDPLNPISVELRNFFFQIDDDDPTLDGAGLKVLNANVTVESCKFTASGSNSAPAKAARGCGIFAVECQLDLFDVSFSSLAAIKGGAIFGSLCTINIKDSTFYGCADYDVMIPIEDELVEAIENEVPSAIEYQMDQLIDEGTAGGAIYVEVCDISLQDCGSDLNAANRGGFLHAVRSDVYMGVEDGVGGGDSYHPEFNPPSRHYASEGTLGAFIYTYRSNLTVEDQLVYYPSSYLNVLGLDDVVETGTFDLTAGTADVTASYLQLETGSTLAPLYLRPLQQGLNYVYTSIIEFDLDVD